MTELHAPQASPRSQNSGATSNWRIGCQRLRHQLLDPADRMPLGNLSEDIPEVSLRVEVVELRHRPRATLPTAWSATGLPCRRSRLSAARVARAIAAIASTVEKLDADRRSTRVRIAWLHGGACDTNRLHQRRRMRRTMPPARPRV